MEDIFNMAGTPQQQQQQGDYYHDHDDDQQPPQQGDYYIVQHDQQPIPPNLMGDQTQPHITDQQNSSYPPAVHEVFGARAQLLSTNAEEMYAYVINLMSNAELLQNLTPEEEAIIFGSFNQIINTNDDHNFTTGEEAIIFSDTNAMINTNQDHNLDVAPSNNLISNNLDPDSGHFFNTNRPSNNNATNNSFGGLNLNSNNHDPETPNHDFVASHQRLKSKKKNTEEPENHRNRDSSPNTANNMHSKRSRDGPSRVHTTVEKVRRDKIKKKLKTLQAMIPNCSTVKDKASMLDEAINYIKYLQNLQNLFKMVSSFQMSMSQFPPFMTGIGMGMGRFNTPLDPFAFHAAREAAFAAAFGQNMIGLVPPGSFMIPPASNDSNSSSRRD